MYETFRFQLGEFLRTTDYASTETGSFAIVAIYARRL